MNPERAVVTLNPAVTTAVRHMGLDMASPTGKPVGPVEVVRRALILLDLKLSLKNDEELVIRNNKTGECDRIRFGWEK